MLEAVRACAPTLPATRLPSALLLARFSVLAMGSAEGDQSGATVPDGPNPNPNPKPLKP